jgi:hypothetical protein
MKTNHHLRTRQLYSGTDCMSTSWLNAAHTQTFDTLNSELKPSVPSVEGSGCICHASSNHRLLQPSRTIRSALLQHW